MNESLQTISQQQMSLDAPRTVNQILEQLKVIQDVMQSVMKDGIHYGTVPGCGPKPTMLKPGAEILAVAFRLTPKFQITEQDLGGGHRAYSVTCSIYSASGNFLGEGVGNCSTMETKYRYRKSEQTCPKCGKNTIIKGKAEYGGGWLCYQRKGGCGEKFLDGDTEIENQNMGRVEHDNPADYYNTCMKMAKKRAQVDATLTVTGASDMFTQDIEEGAEGELQRTGRPPTRQPVPQPTAKPAPAPTAKSNSASAQVASSNVPPAEVAIDPNWLEYLQVAITEIRPPKPNTKQPYAIGTKEHGVLKTWDEAHVKVAQSLLGSSKTATVWYIEKASTNPAYPNSEYHIKVIKAD